MAFNRQSVAAFNTRTIEKLTEENPDEGKLMFGLTAEQRQVIYDLGVFAADFRLELAGDAAAAQGTEAAEGFYAAEGAGRAEVRKAVPKKDLDFIVKALDLVGPDGPPPELWRSFFRGSIAYFGHALAPVKRIGFFNPVVDGWVLTDWSQGDERLELVGVRPVPGEVMRGRPAEGFEPPVWMRMADQTELIALAINHRDSIRAFKNRYRLLAEQPLSDGAAGDPKIYRQIIESRLGVIRRSLIALRRPAFFSTTKDLLAVIASGEAAQLKSVLGGDNDTPVHWVTGLSTPVRTQFQPISVVRRPDGGITVLFGVPRNGRWILVARYGSDDSDRPSLVQTVAFLDFVTAEHWGLDK